MHTWRGIEILVIFATTGEKENFNSSPAKSGEHGGDTAVGTIVITDHPGSTFVDSYDFVFLFAGVWIPWTTDVRSPPFTSPEQSMHHFYDLL